MILKFEQFYLMKQSIIDQINCKKWGNFDSITTIFNDHEIFVFISTFMIWKKQCKISWNKLYGIYNEAFGIKFQNYALIFKNLIIIVDSVPCNRIQKWHWFVMFQAKTRMSVDIQSNAWNWDCKIVSISCRSQRVSISGWFFYYVYSSTEIKNIWIDTCHCNNIDKSKILVLGVT